LSYLDIASRHAYISAMASVINRRTHTPVNFHTVGNLVVVDCYRFTIDTALTKPLPPEPATPTLWQRLKNHLTGNLHLPKIRALGGSPVPALTEVSASSPSQERSR
jgi:hypothetical protein